MPGVLPQQESYHQAFDALLNLEKLADSVFSRVTTKVANERNRLNLVQKRVETAQIKVKQVAAAPKAISVFSPLKYPAAETVTHFQPLFSEMIEPPHPLRTNYVHVDVEKMQERNNLSPIDLSNVIVEASNQKKDISKDGLGRLPQTISSVSGLLLFNSETNPYKQYVSLDNLSLKQREVKESNKKKKELYEAPKSFIEGDNLPSRAVDDIGYKPILNVGEVPELLVPSSLPLPNLSEFSYESKAKSIAPSFVPSDLPAVAPSSSSSSLPSSIPSPPPNTTTTTTTTATNITVASVDTPSLGFEDVPPPPPPPPPEPTITTTTSTSEAPEEDEGGMNSSSSFNEGSGDARNDLLKDIRKGHMSRLKKVKTGEKLETNSKPKKPNGKSSSTAPPSGGNMWKDLERTLRSRRAAIAEKQKEAEEAAATDFNLPESADKDWE